MPGAMAEPGDLGRRLAAATVLYRPEAHVLDALLSPLEAAGVAIFVFVNGPIDTAIEERLARDGIVILRAPENIGLGAALNAVTEAAASAGFSQILLFDQDSTPDRELPGQLLAAFDRATHSLSQPVAAIGPRLVAPPGYLAPWYWRRPGGAERLTEVDFLPTSGTLVDLAAFDAIGRFRADYFIDGIDVEWCFRAWAKGHACLLAEDVTMLHRWGHEAEQGTRVPQILRQSDLRTYFYIRNTVAGFRLPHMPRRWKARLAPRLAAQIGLLLKARRFDPAVRRLVRHAVADGWRGRLGPESEGL